MPNIKKTFQAKCSRLFLINLYLVQFSFYLLFWLDILVYFEFEFYRLEWAAECKRVWSFTLSRSTCSFLVLLFYCCCCSCFLFSLTNGLCDKNWAKIFSFIHFSMEFIVLKSIYQFSHTKENPKLNCLIPKLITEWNINPKQKLNKNK